MKFLKTTVAVFLFATFILYSFIIRFLVTEPNARRRLAIATVHKVCKIGVRVFGVKLKVKNFQYLRHDQNYMILGNHLSYIDILMIASLSPVCFVTSMEIRAMFFIGLLTDLGGCLYVERRTREKLTNEISQIETALRAGFNVIIFPEATSSNGSGVLPFKRALITAAIKAGKSVLPLCINYRSVNAEKLTVANRDRMFWYGDMDFFPHFMGFMAIQEAEVEIDFMPEIVTETNSTRDQVIDLAYKQITDRYIPIV